MNVLGCLIYLALAGAVNYYVVNIAGKYGAASIEYALVDC